MARVSVTERVQELAASLATEIVFFLAMDPCIPSGCQWSRSAQVTLSDPPVCHGIHTGFVSLIVRPGGDNSPVAVNVSLKGNGRFWNGGTITLVATVHGSLWRQQFIMFLMEDELHIEPKIESDIP